MNNIARDAVASMTIEARPERVWEALTSPEQIKEYFLGTDAESTWEVGSPITFAGEWKGVHYEDHGQILAAEPPGLLRITHYSPLSGKPDIPENYHIVEYRIEDDGGASKVTITQGNNGSEDEAAESEKTWQLVLGNLKEFIER